MTEFAQTMKDWHRMCKVMTEKNSYDACSGCPLGAYGCSPVCEGFDTYKDVNFEAVGEKITEWAAEHPEPVYPTWREYIEDYTGIMMIDVIDDPIPADIAEKLEIEPKEGT